MDRLAMLKDLVTQDPTNAFARYGLALEYANRGETETALQEFQKLLTSNPDYVPGYQMAAQTLLKVGREAEAQSMLQQGVEQARKAGNQHALSEMQAMLDELR